MINHKGYEHTVYPATARRSLNTYTTQRVMQSFTTGKLFLIPHAPHVAPASSIILLAHPKVSRI